MKESLPATKIHTLILVAHKNQCDINQISDT